jgi:hypothetical protein
MKEMLTGLAMQIKDAMGNEYGRPKDVAGEKRMAFTSLADTAFDVCFENTFSGRRMPPLSPCYLLVILNWTNLTNLSAITLTLKLQK